MEIKEISQTISPMSKAVEDIGIDKIEKGLVNILCSKEYTNFALYNSSKLNVTNTFIKDIILTFEKVFKSKTSNSDELLVISKVFENIRNNFNLLESLKYPLPSSNEIIVSLCSTLICYIKKNFT